MDNARGVGSLQPTILQALESSDNVESQKSILASFIREVSVVVGEICIASPSI
ncbi:MAG: hypothetical protein LIP03_14940 [Bacteroidales bacterium]|nr:hypothetical protein [Bacteroidales bacterium]